MTKTPKPEELDANDIESEDREPARPMIDVEPCEPNDAIPSDEIPEDYR